MKGQLSAEMLIIIALLLGLVFIVYTQMTKNVKAVGAATDARTQQLIDATSLRSAEVSCAKDVDCQKYNETWVCNLGSGYCTG